MLHILLFYTLFDNVPSNKHTDVDWKEKILRKLQATTKV